MHRKSNNDEPVRSIEVALYDAAHDYPGGVPAVAGAIGQHAGTLQNKLNIGSAEPAPTLRDFRAILDLTRDERILRAVCAPLNYVPVYVGDLARSGDLELIEAVGSIVARVGDTSGDLVRFLEDNRIDARELAALEEDIERVVVAALELKARCREIHEAQAERDVQRISRSVPGKVRAA